MVAVETLSKQINGLKAKQAAGTLTQEAAVLLSELEQQYAEALAQASAEDLQQIAEAAAESAADLVSLPDIGFVKPAAGMGAIGLSGGGGGGGGTVVASVGSSFSGQLINGYISDARVFQDNNGNGTFDSGEPTGTTDSTGRFALDGFVPGAGEIVAQPVWTNSAGEMVTATDRTTGASVSTVFKAPAGSSVVSPLSTLMSAGASQDQIKQAFGLDASIDITSFDPIAAATAPESSAAEIQAALNIKAASTAVSNIFDVSSESLSSAGVDPASASQTAANTITSKLTNPGFSLTDATFVGDTLASIIQDSGAQIDSSVATALSNSLGTKIAAANTATFNAASSGDSDALEQIYKAAKTAQVGIAESATSVLEADDASAALSALDQFDVEAEIESASVPDNNSFGGLDFELEASEYQIEFFEGANGSLLTDPTDSSNSVLKFVRTPESKFYSGMTLGYLTGSTVGEIPINADAGETTINARIWSPSDGIVARMEIADTSAEAEQNMYYNVHAEATLNSGWNEVVFDFANPVIRWVDSTNGEVATPISEDATYDKINLFIDWNNGKDFAGNQVGAAITQDVTYYVDDVVMGFGEPVYYQGGSSETEQEPNISSEPTVAPDAPTAAADDVISLFSDTYTAATTATWSTVWDEADVADVDLGGNAVKKYTDVNFIGIETAATVDASSSDTFNISVWRTDATADLKIKLVDYAGGVWNEATNVEHEINLEASGSDAVAAGEWVDLSLNLSDFTGLTRTDNIAQIIISSHIYGSNGLPVGSGETIYIDNMYFGPSATTTPTSTDISGSSSSAVDLTDYSLVFEDDFNAIGESPNSTNWTFDTGSDGWGNNEVQDYQSDLDDAEIIDWDESSEVNGALRITAKNVDGTITSARVKSDIDVGAYGYYEVRAKLPSETGAWPAIWLLGEGGRSTWPNDGEIDLVEWSAAYASSDQEIISALHYPAAHGGNANDTNATLTSAVDEWHIYQLWWTPDSIKIGVDGTEDDAHLVYSKPENATNNAWPYDGPMDLILNIAIGGTLGGEVPTSNFEYAMDVDYVRIYQMDGVVAEVTPTELTLTFDSE